MPRYMRTATVYSARMTFSAKGLGCVLDVIQLINFTQRCMNLSINSVVDPLWSRRVRNSCWDNEVGHLINPGTDLGNGCHKEANFILSLLGKVESLTGKYLNNGIPKSNAAQRGLDSEVVNHMAGRKTLPNSIPSPSFDYNVGSLFVDSAGIRAEWVMSLDCPGLTVPELKKRNFILPSADLPGWSHFLRQ
jgi:hypothetical protein